MEKVEIRKEIIKYEGKELLGIKIDLSNMPILFLFYKNFVFACGAFNEKAFEKFGFPCCIVTGVKEFEDILNGEIKAVNSKAPELGAKVGLKVKEFLKYLE
jgi:uncharacterized protein YunC (DUF1805 family)